MSGSDGEDATSLSCERDALAASPRAATLAEGATDRSRGARRLLRMAVLSGLVLSGFVAGVTVTDRVVFALADVQAREPVGALPGAATVIVAVDTDVMPPRSPGPAFETRVCPDGTTRRNVRCGFLDVPESRSDPEGRRVRIAVSIRQARSSASSSDEPRRAVVVLSGGPGAPLLNEAAAYQTSRALGVMPRSVVDA
jgi:hypothetical protein